MGVLNDWYYAWLYEILRGLPILERGNFYTDVDAVPHDLAVGDDFLNTIRLEYNNNEFRIFKEDVVCTVDPTINKSKKYPFCFHNCNQPTKL